MERKAEMDGNTPPRFHHFCCRFSFLFLSSATHASRGFPFHDNPLTRVLQLILAVSILSCISASHNVCTYTAYLIFLPPGYRGYDCRNNLFYDRCVQQSDSAATTIPSANCRVTHCDFLTFSLARSTCCCIMSQQSALLQS